ncbi:MAG: SpoVR family protein [Myxococcales bacterium]|nr:MAG: SpoVR family protein [Myxococcales bacterium]
MQRQIEAYAREYGLDCFPLSFEVLSYEQMNEIAAFGGFPGRYPHWRFGMEYEQLSKSYEYGLSKIYEMVINNNPAIAYLLEGNSMVEQKLVMAHVYAHVDFFKNNFTFKKTDQGMDPEQGLPIRKWVDTLANHGAVIRRWVNRVGVDEVETFIDHCLSLENLIDSRHHATRSLKKDSSDSEQEQVEELPRLRVDHDYMEDYINPKEFLDRQKKIRDDDKARAKKFPEHAERDVLGFLLEHAPLERWEREVLSIIRREALYFAPQAQTKIMNEGWATYWHSKIMTERAATGSEIIDYADRCASVLASSPGQLNPYKLGVELYKHIEERWNKGQFGREWEQCDTMHERQNWDKQLGLGRKKIFEVRAYYNDVTFIDEFLTPEFVAAQKMYSFGYNKRNNRWEIESRVFKEVKDKLLFALTNAGQPFINVEDANYANRGELILAHEHRGVDLKVDYAHAVLESLNRVWKRPVEVHTIIEEKASALRYDGSEHTQRHL